MYIACAIMMLLLSTRIFTFIKLFVQKLFLVEQYEMADTFRCFKNASMSKTHGFHHKKRLLLCVYSIIHIYLFIYLFTEHYVIIVGLVVEYECMNEIIMPLGY